MSTAGLAYILCYNAQIRPRVERSHSELLKANC